MSGSVRAPPSSTAGSRPPASITSRHAPPASTRAATNASSVAIGTSMSGAARVRYGDSGSRLPASHPDAASSAYAKPSKSARPHRDETVVSAPACPVPRADRAAATATSSATLAGSGSTAPHGRRECDDRLALYAATVSEPSPRSSPPLPPRGPGAGTTVAVQSLHTPHLTASAHAGLCGTGTSSTRRAARAGSCLPTAASGRGAPQRGSPHLVICRLKRARAASNRAAFPRAATELHSCNGLATRGHSAQDAHAAFT